MKPGGGPPPCARAGPAPPPGRRPAAARRREGAPGVRRPSIQREAWLGRRAQASTRTAPPAARALRRVTKSRRSVASRTMLRRSSPRPITWCRVSGVSRRAWRGRGAGALAERVHLSTVPDTLLLSRLPVPIPYSAIQRNFQSSMPPPAWIATRPSGSCVSAEALSSGVRPTWIAASLFPVVGFQRVRRFLPCSTASRPSLSAANSRAF